LPLLSSSECYAINPGKKCAGDNLLFCAFSQHGNFTIMKIENIIAKDTAG
jgi:proline dehydrogenase